MSDSPLPVGKLPFELLSSLLAMLPHADESVIVGPGLGRDAAVIDISGTLVVLKNDPITFVTQDAGVYLVNVNANDLACLGAVPRWMLVTALLPEGSCPPEMVSELFQQLRETCADLGISLVGGHTEVTAGVVRPLLSGTLIGTAGPTGLLFPGSARRGDRLLLARPAGIEGTAMLASERALELELAFGSDVVRRAQHFLRKPGISVVPVARALLETGAVTALHDPTEGGVATGVREMGLASNLGAIMNRQLVPILDETRMIAAHFDIDPLGMLSSGTLLATVSPDQVEAVIGYCAGLGIDVVQIGKLTSPETGFRLIDDNRTFDLPNFQTDEVSRALAAN